MEKNDKIVIERNVGSLKLNNKVFCVVDTATLDDINSCIDKINKKGFISFNQSTFIRSAIKTFIDLIKSDEIELGVTFRTRKIGHIKSKCEEENNGRRKE